MKPKKHFGQHFLTSPAYARRISDAVPASADCNVLEIGPGQGALSIHLKSRFPRFHVVEIDTDALPKLREKLGDGEYMVHRADVLEFDFANAGFPLHVVGNLPYNIGALIIRKTLSYGNRVRSCTFMVQREVATRIVASPHNKQNGFLSIFCQFFGTPKILFHVPPGAFFPRPAVDSSVFQIQLLQNLEDRLPQNRWESFFAFVDRGFSMRRKQLAKILGFTNGRKEYYAAQLSTMGLDPQSRPEDLGIEEWLSLYKQLEGPL